MYILTEGNPGNLYLIPVDEQSGIRLEDGTLRFNGSAPCRVINGQDITQDELQARFEDIVRAMKSGKVAVYDVRKPLGTQPKTTQKPAAAPKEQSAPAPKQGS